MFICAIYLYNSLTQLVLHTNTLIGDAYSYKDRELELIQLFRCNPDSFMFILLREVGREVEVGRYICRNHTHTHTQREGEAEREGA